MFTIVPASAAPPTGSDFHALLSSATATAAAIAPHLSLHKADGTTVTHTIRKVASCQHFYSALLRNDGTLLLLASVPAAAAGSIPSTSAPPTLNTNGTAWVSALESGGEAVRDVAAGASHIVYCTVSGAVYSCGYDNTYGQLGDGTVWASASPPTRHSTGSVDGSAIPPLSVPRRIVGFGDRGASAAAAAAASCDRWSATDTSFASTNDAAGDTQKAGAEPSSPTRYVPPPCSRHIRQVACGAHHTLLLTQTGRCVYACGRGDRGALGSARAVPVQPSFRSISLLFGLAMRQVAAADAHSFALLENGLLYAFGDNVCGQLGLGNTTRVNLPTFVPLTGQEEATVTGPKPTAVRSLPLDGKAYASLRAPYGSAASSYYPLRVPRLQTDTGDVSGVSASASRSLTTATLVDACVRWVHCCGSWTLLETSRSDVWLSCGTALTRGVSATAAAARIDGCGVLGRALAGGSTAEAHRFRPVQWPSLLKAGQGSWEVAAAPPEWAREEINVGVPLPSVDVHCHVEGNEEANDDDDDGGASHGRCPTNAPSVAGDAATIHNSASSVEHRRGSDTEPSLCNTKKTMKGEETAEGGICVCPYATTLLVLLADEEGWTDATVVQGQDGPVELQTSRLLVQSGTPSAVSVEVTTTKGASSWALVAGSAAEAEAAAAGPHAGQQTPSGASVLRVRSAHRQFVPLPSYALFL